MKMSLSDLITLEFLKIPQKKEIKKNKKLSNIMENETNLINDGDDEKLDINTMEIFSFGSIGKDNTNDDGMDIVKESKGRKIVFEFKQFDDDEDENEDDNKNIVSLTNNNNDDGMDNNNNL
eukprot:525356_1